MADGFIGHMREQIVIPAEGQVALEQRRIPEGATGPMERQDFLDVDVAPMPVFGRGFRAHVTSSCHDEHGMRNLSDPAVMHNYLMRPIEKILNHRDDIIQVQADYADSEIVLVTYGTVSRSARAAAQIARQQGLRVGTLRLVTCWPFPDREIRQMAENVDYVLVIENNNGQLYPYIKAEAVRDCPVDFLRPQIMGQIHDPEYIVTHMKEIIK
jgi:2-oxoglutarate ferredoxin oxidoreductase subunit alpha